MDIIDHKMEKIDHKTPRIDHKPARIDHNMTTNQYPGGFLYRIMKEFYCLKCPF